jgi:hypothetical protein
MDKKLPHFLVYGYYKVMLMYQKIPIHYSWVNGIFLKLTPSIRFLPLFNYKVPIVICHMFLDTLRIVSIESCHACLNITKVRKVF